MKWKTYRTIEYPTPPRKSLLRELAEAVVILVGFGAMALAILFLVSLPFILVYWFLEYLNS